MTLTPERQRQLMAMARYAVAHGHPTGPIDVEARRRRIFRALFRRT